jgi:hypothetical protein
MTSRIDSQAIQVRVNARSEKQASDLAWKYQRITPATALKSIRCSHSRHRHFGGACEAFDLAAATGVLRTMWAFLSHHS